MYKIELTPEHLNYIGAVLGRCPYNEVLPILTVLQKQVDEQTKVVAENANKPATSEV